MDLNKKLENLLKEKKSLTSDIEICCNSIDFWEKRAEKMFNKMDAFEENSFLESEENNTKEYKRLMHESEKLMARINFENTQLDILEAKILELEEKIITAIKSHAQKQKK
tara:strand:- start:185 stop:514 length:330 start_codon:yes stop_codon:yes gene_type:complete